MLTNTHKLAVLVGMDGLLSRTVQHALQLGQAAAMHRVELAEQRQQLQELQQVQQQLEQLQLQELQRVLALQHEQQVLELEQQQMREIRPNTP